MTPMKWRNSAKSMHQVYSMKSMVPSSMTQDKALQKNERNCKESGQWHYCTVLVFIEIRYSPSFSTSIKNKQHSYQCTMTLNSISVLGNYSTKLYTKSLNLL